MQTDYIKFKRAASGHLEVSRSTKQRVIDYLRGLQYAILNIEKRRLTKYNKVNQCSDS